MTDQLDRRGWTVRLVRKAFKALPDPKAPKVNKAPKVWVRKAPKALLATQALPAHKGLLVILVRKARPVRKVTKVLPDPRVIKATRVLLVGRGFKGPRGNRAFRVILGQRGPKARLAQLEIEANKDFKVRKVSKARTAARGFPVRKGLKAIKVRKAYQAPLAPRAHRVHKVRILLSLDPKDPKVFKVVKAIKALLG
jgi:hypothetical protein